MSRRTLGSDVPEEMHNAIDELREDRGWEHKSKAHRAAVEQGLAQLGYLDGGKTPAQRTVETVAVGLLCVGATLAVLSLLTSVTLLYGGLGVLFGALGTMVASRVVLPRFEPHVTNRLPRIEVTRHGD
jgi:hypothetical protein